MNSAEVEDLSCACIHSESVRYDFSQGYPEDWDYRQATEEDGKVYVFPDDQDEFEQEFGHGLWERCEGPMMNYYYPLDVYGIDPEKAARKIVSLPLCVVEFGMGYDSHPEFALALTGGGMDLSWEIALAYVWLGYLPPLEYCDLPAMAGKQFSGDTELTWRACKRSVRVAQEQLQRRSEDLDNLRLKLLVEEQ